MGPAWATEWSTAWDMEFRDDLNLNYASALLPAIAKRTDVLIEWSKELSR
jgi:hypothetical protein